MTNTTWTAPATGHHAPTPHLLALVTDCYNAAPHGVKVSLGIDPIPFLSADACAAPQYRAHSAGENVQVQAYPSAGSRLALTLRALTVCVQDNCNRTHTATIRGDYLGAVIELRLTYAP